MWIISKFYKSKKQNTFLIESTILNKPVLMYSVNILYLPCKS